MTIPAVAFSTRNSRALHERREWLSRARSRRLLLEGLEERALMAMLPYGAMPDDVAEYMLGDVVVSVVLMESTPSQAPNDINQEDWTAQSIGAIKSKIEEGVGWWKETLLKTFPSVSDQLLNFKFDYTFADSPVQTGYEPINRVSSDYTKWIKDFIGQSGVTSTGSVGTDIRRFNDAQRRALHGSWGFTIFVVNDEHDADGMFPAGGAGNFRQAFAFAADKYMVVPANRPAETFTHEMGHMFWAYDEYLGGDSYARHRGYYDTHNLNAADSPGHSQEASIMAADVNGGVAYRSDAFAGNISAPSTLATIGWQDSDGDGVFDVLDVPFKLEGSGWYDTSDSTYKFLGNSAVRTLLNRNPEGLGNDITINVIREAQYSLDGGAWQTAETFDSYAVDLQLVIPAAPGSHTLKLRTVDTITGAHSPEFVVENTEIPEIAGESGVQGYVWYDTNADGDYDLDELPAVDVPVWLVDSVTHLPVNLQTRVDPDDYPSQSTVASSEATFSATSIFGTPLAHTGEVVASGSVTAPTAGKVLAAKSQFGGQSDTWSIRDRALRIDFNTPTSAISIRVWGGTGASRGRLEAYNAQGQLLDRVTTSVLSSPSSTAVLSLTRNEGDIAYVLAGGDMETSVVLDDVEWGARSKVTTDSAGVYRIPELGPGNYELKINPGKFQVVSTPSQGFTQVSVDPSGPQMASFGLVQLPNPWHNRARLFDADDNGSVNVNDILLQIYYYQKYSQATLPTVGPTEAAYVDVNDDGFINVNDILATIYQYQIDHGFNPNGTAGSTSGGNLTTGGSGGSSSGESPLYVDHVVGNEDHHDHVDTGASAGEALPLVGTAVSTVTPLAGFALESEDQPTADEGNEDAPLWSQQVSLAFTGWDSPNEDSENTESTGLGGDDSTTQISDVELSLRDLLDEPLE